MRPLFSLIVPTRGRPAQLRRMLESVAHTAAHPERVEVILVTDGDDPNSLLMHPRLKVCHAIGAPGRTMGELNNAGFAASSGRYVMLLNDDVIVRTRGWDAIALRCFQRFPDPFVLLHVNDTLMREHLCTFPLTSRTFFELCGAVCPTEYQRYRIDDHIEDVFNLLAVAGERRVVYLPDVVFEHDNATLHPEAGAVYLSDPVVLAADAPQFDALLPQRKELARRVLAAVGSRADAVFDAVTDSFAIRTAGRQIVVRTPWWRGPADAAGRALATANRARNKSARDVLRALRKRLPGCATRTSEVAR